MDAIPDILRGVITHVGIDEEVFQQNFYERIENIPIRQKNKKDELFSIIETFTKEKINPKNWEYRGGVENCYSEYDSDQTCICSENDCRHLFFKTHIKSNLTFKLGSQCILKFHNKNDETDNEIEKKNEEKILNEAMRNSKKETCKNDNCGKKVLDKRKKHCKYGYCSEKCQIDMTPLCLCETKCVRRVVKKNNINHGRFFFTCSNFFRDYDGDLVKGCNFFEWEK